MPPAMPSADECHRFEARSRTTSEEMRLPPRPCIIAPPAAKAYHNNFILIVLLILHVLFIFIKLVLVNTPVVGVFWHASMTGAAQSYSSPNRSPQRAPAEQMSPPDEKSPLVGAYGQRPVGHGSGGRTSVTWSGAGGDKALSEKLPPVSADEEYHRCYRTYGAKPFFMVSAHICHYICCTGGSYLGFVQGS